MDNENNFKDFTDWIFSLSGLDYTIAAVTIAIVLSKGLDVNEQNSVGSFFFLIENPSALWYNKNNDKTEGRYFYEYFRWF